MASDRWPRPADMYKDHNQTQVGGPQHGLTVPARSNPGRFPISGIAVDNSDPTGKTAYATVMGFHVSHLWKTSDAGVTWNDFSGTLPDAPANAVLVDTAASTVYVGTDVGVFASSTASANWTEAGPAPDSGIAGYLPNTAVTALRMFNSGGTKKLRASTYGRGIWELTLAEAPDFRVCRCRQHIDRVCRANCKLFGHYLHKAATPAQSPYLYEAGYFPAVDLFSHTAKPDANRRECNFQRECWWPGRRLFVQCSRYWK